MDQSDTEKESKQFLAWLNLQLTSEMEVTFTEPPESTPVGAIGEVQTYYCQGEEVREGETRKRDLLISGREQETQQKRPKVEGENTIEYWTPREDETDEENEYQTSVLEEQYVANNAMDLIETETLNTTDWNVEQRAQVDFWKLKIGWIVNEECELRYKAYLTRTAHDSLVIARRQARMILEELEEAQRLKATPGTFMNIEKRLAYAIQRVEVYILRFCRNRNYRFVKF